MGQFIVKLEKENEEPRYLLWSTIVDAPITYGCELKEFKEFCRDEFGRREFERTFPERMKRVEEKGTSSMIDRNARELMQTNRAGPDESKLTYDQIWTRYVTQRPASKETT